MLCLLRSSYVTLTTASPHNFDYVTSLEASQVFDYNSPTLQRIEGLSDREAVDRFSFDARWKYAAGGLDFDYPGFVHTVLVDMRARLAASQAQHHIGEQVDGGGPDLSGDVGGGSPGRSAGAPAGVGLDAGL